MRHLASIRWAALALALCGLWSCSGSRTASESTSQGAAAVLDAYEGVRSLLADDKVQGVSDAAAQLADAARSASASAAERLRPSLGDIANTADQLRQALFLEALDFPRRERRRAYHFAQERKGRLETVRHHRGSCVRCVPRGVSGERTTQHLELVGEGTGVETFGAFGEGRRGQ